MHLLKLPSCAFSRRYHFCVVDFFNVGIRLERNECMCSHKGDYGVKRPNIYTENHCEITAPTVAAAPNLKLVHQ